MAGWKKIPKTYGGTEANKSREKEYNQYTPMVQKMNYIIKYFRKYGFLLWLGFSLAVFGDMKLTDGAFWIITMPTLALWIFGPWDKNG